MFDAGACCEVWLFGHGSSNKADLCTCTCYVVRGAVHPVPSVIYPGSYGYIDASGSDTCDISRNDCTARGNSVLFFVVYCDCTWVTPMFSLF